jgi:hypothetical protein
MSNEHYGLFRESLRERSSVGISSPQAGASREACGARNQPVESFACPADGRVIVLHGFLHGLQKLAHYFLGRSLFLHNSRVRSRKKQRKRSTVDCGVLFSTSPAELGFWGLHPMFRPYHFLGGSQTVPTRQWWRSLPWTQHYLERSALSSDDKRELEDAGLHRSNLICAFGE